MKPALKSDARIGRLINLMGTCDPPQMMVKFRCPHCLRASFVKMHIDPQTFREQDFARATCEHCQGGVLL